MPLEVDTFSLLLKEGWGQVKWEKAYFAAVFECGDVPANQAAVPHRPRTTEDHIKTMRAAVNHFLEVFLLAHGSLYLLSARGCFKSNFLCIAFEEP